MTKVIGSGRVCVIGANSKVVQTISWPDNFELVSHKNLGSLNLCDYDAFVIFSWSHDDNDQNIEIFKALRGYKAIFISSISVLALLVRGQWNNYPNDKALLERLYWEEGNSIIRLGVCSDNYNSSIPFTSPDIILTAILDCVSSVKQKIVTPFEVISRKDPSKAERFFNKLSFLSDAKIWRILCEAAVKCLPGQQTLLYGYTADCVNLLVKPIQLGYGALGSRNNEAKKCQIIVDPRPNLMLERDGFRDTWIGRDRIGLSNLWHGVRIVKKGHNYFKKVPVFIRRKKPPLGAVSMPVKSIDFANRMVNLETNLLVLPNIPYRGLYMAMGALPNAIELSKNLEISMSLSDHSIASIGALKTRELVGMGYLKKAFFLLAGRKVFVSEEKEFMLDFRPRVDGDDNLGENFYNQLAAGVIKKVFQRFSFSRLNQAFFNKFGICIWVNEMDVWVQVLMRDCILISGNKVVKKMDESKLAEVLDRVRVGFPNIRMKKDISLFDAQHIMGGQSFLEKNSVGSLKERFGIEIIGVPNEMELDALHHTSTLINYISKSKP